MANNLSCALYYIFLLLLNASMFLSHSLMPTTSKNLVHLSYLQSLIGAHKGNQTEGIFELKKYLSNIGYMNITSDDFKRPHNQDTNQNLFDDHLELALKKYQQFFKLNLSGILDSQTISNLNRPRCGVPDFNRHAIFKTNLTHLKSGSLYTFLPGEPKWQTLHLTYSFPPGTRADVMGPIEKALAQWSWATKNSFTFARIPNYDQANIKISFQVGNHGDGANFDGLGGILAHAFAPSDGKLHYDGSESWVDGIVPNKFDLQTVGMHELGHVLGLGHSQDQASIMFPYIGPGTRKGLTRDDIIGINLLYGFRKKIS